MCTNEILPSKGGFNDALKSAVSPHLLSRLSQQRPHYLLYSARKGRREGHYKEELGQEGQVRKEDLGMLASC